MGAKASTNQSPQRTFSTSSSSDVVSAGNNNPTSFNFLRAIEVANDSRQRARSMSSVPDQSAGTNAYSNHASNSQPYSHADVNSFQNSGAGPHFDLSSSISSEERSNHEEGSSVLQGINLGRVYTAASLPSHNTFWSINGEYGHLAGSKKPTRM